MSPEAYYSPEMMTPEIVGYEGYEASGDMFQGQYGQEIVCEEVSQVDQQTAVSSYAHSQSSGSSMKNVKRELCQFWLKGCCERGVTCTYAHGEQQIGDGIVAAPVVTCKFWLEGRCRQGSKCQWAHVETSDPNELFAQAPEDAKVAAKSMLKPKREMKQWQEQQQWNQQHQQQQQQQWGGNHSQQWNRQGQNGHNGQQWNQRNQAWDQGHQGHNAQQWNQGHNQAQNWNQQNQTQQWNQHHNNQHNQHNQHHNNQQWNESRPSYENQNFNRAHSNRYSNTSNGSTAITTPTNSTDMMQTVQGLQDEAKATASGVSAPLQVTKPQSEEERLKLLALLGDVVAALK